MTWGTPPPFSPATVYATRVRYRSPEWKIHTSRGRANAALSCHDQGEVWESTPTGGWLLVRTEGAS